MKKLSLLLLFCCMGVQAQPYPSFYMGKFKVTVTTARHFLLNGQVDPRPIVPRQDGMPFPSGDRTLRGTGTVTFTVAPAGSVQIRNIPVPVNFEQVVLRYNSLAHQWEAIRGFANCRAITNLGYILGSTLVLMRESSLRLTPVSASAEIAAEIPLSIMTSEAGYRLRLASESCEIAPDGSVYGNNFLGHNSFHLKRAPDSIDIPQNTAQTVRLGPAFCTQLGQQQEVLFKGMAYVKTTNLFSFQGRFLPAAQQASIHLTLLNTPVQRIPEQEYSLILKNGGIEYQYGPLGITSCSGSFLADLRLPQRIRKLDGSAIAFNDITLMTDATRSLFNTVVIAETIPITNIFSMTMDTAYAYFPHWMLPEPPIDYTRQDSLCPGLRERLLWTHRPGVTLTKGIIIFKSPQVKIGSSQVDLKSRYLGALTCTKDGITGDITTADKTFIPFSSDNSQIAKIAIPPDSTWNGILSLGNTHPHEPAEIFRMANLRILEMHIVGLQFCKSSMGKSAFRYTVHFPHPSFINLQFEDSSLNYAGRFTKAFGPVVSHGWNYQRSPDDAAFRAVRDAYIHGTLQNLINTRSVVGDSTLLEANQLPSLPNPKTQILWAYRMPVSFTERGLSIDYRTTTVGDAAEIKILMNTLFNIRHENVRNELWIPNLYSKNSGLKKGIRFSGTLDSLGKFAVTQLDPAPMFARAYIRPGNERIRGYFCANPAIQMLDAASLMNPAGRATDYTWQGQIEFPFFGYKMVKFSVRNVIPTLVSPTSLEGTGTFITGCGGDRPVMNVTASQMDYSAASNKFVSKNIQASEGGSSIGVDSMEILSFTNAWLNLKDPGSGSTRDTVIKNTVSTSCDAQKSITEILHNPKYSSTRKDLVCYDAAACSLSGRQDWCCNQYYIGTLVIIETTHGIADTTITAPNTAWYPYANKYVMQNSDLSLKSGDEKGSGKITIPVLPGAQLMISETTIAGKFEGSIDVLGEKCSIELNFLVDRQCGYFYVYADAQFPIYSFTFDGQVFIVHAPLTLLEAPSPFGGKPILTEVARGLLTCPGNLKSWTGMGTGIVSGVLMAGGVSIDYDIVTLTAVGGLGFVQCSSGENANTVTVSLIATAAASADLEVVDIEGYLQLHGTYSHNSLTGDELIAGGSFCIGGCVSIFIGHCSCLVRIPDPPGCSFSTKTGFHFGDLDLSASCGWGGCPDICSPDCPPE